MSTAATSTTAETPQQFVPTTEAEYGDGIIGELSCPEDRCPAITGPLDGTDQSNGASCGGVMIGPGAGGTGRNTGASSGAAIGVGGNLVIGPRAGSEDVPGGPSTEGLQIIGQLCPQDWCPAITSLLDGTQSNGASSGAVVIGPGAGGRGRNTRASSGAAIGVGGSLIIGVDSGEPEI